MFGQVTAHAKRRAPVRVVRVLRRVGLERYQVVNFEPASLAALGTAPAVAMQDYPSRSTPAPLIERPMVP